ncbi:hypothetical protein [Variovorax rhizosphaerae]|uniref:KTSC domain-containing protein n=1 Tax=Variovorax rhizosphaerae TaxID=1836200 RepID=A0ABU8WSH6_9BURK
MPRYKNLDGTSGVLAYECAPGAIAVRFTDGDVYIYTDASTGRATVEQMQMLARRGRGLSTFISRYVRERYFDKVERKEGD